MDQEQQPKPLTAEQQALENIIQMAAAFFDSQIAMARKAVNESVGNK